MGGLRKDKGMPKGIRRRTQRWAVQNPRPAKSIPTRLAKPDSTFIQTGNPTASAGTDVVDEASSTGKVTRGAKGPQGAKAFSATGRPRATATQTKTNIGRLKDPMVYERAADTNR